MNLLNYAVLIYARSFGMLYSGQCISDCSRQQYHRVYHLSTTLAKQSICRKLVVAAQHTLLVNYLLGKMACTFWRVENLIIEHREVECQTQPDGMSGCQVHQCNVLQQKIHHTQTLHFRQNVMQSNKSMTIIRPPNTSAHVAMFSKCAQTTSKCAQTTPG